MGIRQFLVLRIGLYTSSAGEFAELSWMIDDDDDDDG
jgi:hypothetical protein